MTAQPTEDPSDPLVILRDLQRPRSRSDAEPLKVAAVHRIEQPRHQGQPLALAFVVMIKNVL